MTAPTQLASTEAQADRTGAASPSEMTSLASASVANGVASAMGSVASFGLTVLAAHQLGVGRAGLYFQGVAVTTIAAAVCTFGAESGAMRQLSRARALGREVDVRPTIAGAVVPVVILATLAALIVEIAAPSLARAFSPSQAASMTRALRILGLILPFVAGERVLTAAMRGLGVNTPTAVIDGVGQPILCLLTGAVVALISPSLVTFTIAWGVPSVAAAIVAYAWLFKVLHERAGTGPWWQGVEHRRQLTVEFWSFTWARGLAQIFQVGTVWIVVLLMGLLGSTQQAGIYGAVSRVAIIGSLVLQSINLVLAPRIPAALAVGDNEGAQRLYQVATGWAVVSGFPIYIMLALFPGTFVAVFGQRYLAGATALSVLCVAMLWNLATGPVTVVLVMAGRSRWNLYNAAATLMVCVAAGALLIPRFGVTGAALAWAAAILVENGLPLIEVRWLMGLQPFSRATLFAGAMALTTFGGLGLVVRLAGKTGFEGAFLAGVPALAAYLAILRVSSIGQETEYVTQALRDVLRRRSIPWDGRLPKIAPSRILRPVGLTIFAVGVGVCLVAATAVGLTRNHTGLLPGPAAEPVASAPTTVPTTTPAPAVDPNVRYSVSGNQIVDQTGKPFTPYGIVIYGLSYHDWNLFADKDLQQIQAAATSWHANVVRLQVDPAALLRQTPYDPDMMRQVDIEIQTAEQYHLDVILNLQNENDRVTPAAALPDDLALHFWQLMAPRYRNDTHIWYDLFNEPRIGAFSLTGDAADPNTSTTRDRSQEGKLVTIAGGGTGLELAAKPQAWKVWHDGGFGFIGMQALVDTVRGSGAQNLIIAETIQTASTVSGLIPLKGTGVVYAIHPYFHRNEMAVDWDGLFGQLSHIVPVFVDEWNQYASDRNECALQGPTLVPQFLAYLHAHGIGLVAWGIGNPGTLILQAKDYVTPTSFDSSRPYQCVGNPTSVPPQGAGQLILNYFGQYSQPPPP